MVQHLIRRLQGHFPQVAYKLRKIFGSKSLKLCLGSKKVYVEAIIEYFCMDNAKLNCNAELKPPRKPNSRAGLINRRMPSGKNGSSSDDTQNSLFLIDVTFINN